YLTSPAAARWMRRQKRPVIGWGLGAPASSGIMRSFWRAYLRQFDALITYSQTGFDQDRRVGVDARRIFIAPNAAAPKPRHPLAPRPETFAQCRAIVLFVGRLQARKRVDVLLQACAALPEALQPELWIVGDGPEKLNLEMMAQAVYPRAHFLGGKYGSELVPLFEAADVFTLPGTGGLAVQQAMSYGLPVIVGEADGTQADLVRAENGVLIQPGSIESLRAALQSLLGSPGQLRQMGRQSYRIVSEEINLEKMVQVFSDVARFVLEN
ncbi:MAG: glycosyltransferase family 4 protein, partial [Anaerolineaceae bacterium]